MKDYIVIYDSDCGICSQVTLLLQKIDKRSKLSFVAIHDSDNLLNHFNIEKSLTDKTIIFIKMTDEKAYIRFQGVLEILKTQDGIYSFIGIIFSNKLFYLIFNPLYDLIAKNRSKISAFLGLNACKIVK